MKEGAFDFIQKPVDLDHLNLLLDRAAKQQELLRENLLLREEYSARYGFPRIVGEHPAMKEASQMTQRVAATDSTVLLLGESGTGKELFARAIHHLSPRAEQPFVALNCAAIPEGLVENELFGHERGAYTGAGARKIGKLELAHRGTLFLDEIGELPLAIQSKLLRVLEERKFERVGGTQEIEVNVRIVTATNKDLQRAVADKTFREDLYFRISAVPITIPPLRERGDDVVLLAEHFLERFRREFRKPSLELTPDAALACGAMPGPATCANCKTPSSARPSWRTARRSIPARCSYHPPNRLLRNFPTACWKINFCGMGRSKKCLSELSRTSSDSRFRTLCANRSGIKRAPRKNSASPTKLSSPKSAPSAS